MRGGEAWALYFTGHVYSQVSSGATMAHQFYGDALKLACELEARPLQARCHLRMGLLDSGSDVRTTVREELTTAATMFREMGMKLWLEKTESSLGGLSADAGMD
jgi:hypothetical protein